MTNSRRMRVWKNFLGDSRARKMGVVLSAAIIVLGAVATVAIGGMKKSVAYHHSEGIVIDYGNYNTVWTHVDFTEETADPVELLNIACDKNHDTPAFKDGKLMEIKTRDRTISNDSGHEWGLWYVKKGECDFKKSDTYKINASDYTVVSWAYTANGERPTVAVDALGTSIYDHPRPNCVVTLSRACEDTIIFINEYNAMDKYNVRYEDLGYESIMKGGHDIVFCDSSMGQDKMAYTLRDSSVDCVVTYVPRTLKDVVDNIFIAGTVVGCDARDDVIKNINKTLADVKEKGCAAKGYNALVALSSDRSPWVAGKGSYVDDVVTLVNGSNVLGDTKYSAKSYNGWLRIAPAEVMEVNPDCIVILDCPFEGREKEYGSTVNSLSVEWRKTNAYKNEKIYLFTGEAGRKAQLAGPATISFIKVVAKMINPDAFGDGTPIPHEVRQLTAYYADVC